MQAIVMEHNNHLQHFKVRVILIFWHIIHSLIPFICIKELKISNITYCLDILVQFLDRFSKLFDNCQLFFDKKLPSISILPI
jgi:hypothetical protein